MKKIADFFFGIALISGFLLAICIFGFQYVGVAIQYTLIPALGISLSLGCFFSWLSKLIDRTEKS